MPEKNLEFRKGPESPSESINPKHYHQLLEKHHQTSFENPVHRIALAIAALAMAKDFQTFEFFKELKFSKEIYFMGFLEI